MKTNESDSPWDPKPEDQKVDGSAKLYKEAIDQLDRDTLRFLELNPDIKMSNVKISTNIAFPLAQELSERALTKHDFEPENANLLLKKLGIPTESLSSQQSCSSRAVKKGAVMRVDREEIYKKLVSRYLGAHSNVSAKIDIDVGFQALDIAIKGTEGGFEAQASESQFCGEAEVENMRNAVAKDPRMKEIRRAVLVPKFGKRFQKENPNIPLNELKSDSMRFLKQSRTKSFPLFGLPVVKAVIMAADNDVAHQGAEAVTEVLVKENYVFFNENGEPLDPKTIVDECIQDCRDCYEVQEIKSKVPPSEEHHLQIPEALEHEVLLFADRRHRGFAEAYRRVKPWASFPDFKRKVLQFAKESLAMPGKCDSLGGLSSKNVAILKLG